LYILILVREALEHLHELNMPLVEVIFILYTSQAPGLWAGPEILKIHLVL
jgi:hypothetical protein